MKYKINTNVGFSVVEKLVSWWSWAVMLVVILTCAVCSITTASASDPGWVGDYDSLIQKYVKADGVRYQAWYSSQVDKGSLADIVSRIGKTKLAGLNQSEQLAFYLNSYNALILHRILENYPTKGPGGGGLLGRNRFFKSENLVVAGQKLSFSSLENEVIRPKFDDARIHFALNCASRSCPPLAGKAFRGATLDGVLNQLTKDFVNNNPNGVIAEKGKVKVSKIFSWYEEDFQQAGGVLAYINQYRNTPVKGKVEYQKYHWVLNASK